MSLFENVDRNVNYFKIAVSTQVNMQPSNMRIFIASVPL